MRFGTLDFRLGDGLGEAGPFAEGEVDEVVDAGDFVGDEVDAPEAWEVSCCTEEGRRGGERGDTQCQSTRY